MARHRHNRRSHKLVAFNSCSTFRTVLKLLFLLSSFVSLPIAFLYLYPLLLPPFSSTIPVLWTSTTSWLTPPLLFLLLNLLVCSLFASSGYLTRQHHPQTPPSFRKGAHDELEKHHAAAPAQSSFAPRAITVPQRSLAQHEHLSHVEQPTRGHGKPVSTPVERLGQSKSFKAQTKEKANSDRRALQIPQKPQTSVQQASAKAMTSDEHDARLNTSDADEELDDVDKRADEYIVQFYQRMKLQRIESLMRKQGSIDRIR